jgi:hypothetical protein
MKVPYSSSLHRIFLKIQLPQFHLFIFLWEYQFSSYDQFISQQGIYTVVSYEKFRIKEIEYDISQLPNILLSRS